MGKGKDSGSSSRRGKKVDEKDQEKTLDMIENQDFIAMKTAVKNRPAPTTKEAQLEELAALGLIQKKALAEWRAPGEHRVPVLNPGEIVLFVSFVCAGLCLPDSSFLHHFLHYFSISLHDFTPNGVLHITVFLHFCEAFLGILPSITLFRYFFHLKSQPKTDTTQFRQGKQKEFFDYTLVDSVKYWHSEWFYTSNMSPPLVVHSDVRPVPNDRWD